MTVSTYDLCHVIFTGIGYEYFNQVLVYQLYYEY